MLIHLPNGKEADQVRDALVAAVETLPSSLKRTLTWDQGSEMSCGDKFTAKVNVPVYFCDPHSPWQRPTNENRNGLLEWPPKVGLGS